MRKEADKIKDLVRVREKKKLWPKFMQDQIFHMAVSTNIFANSWLFFHIKQSLCDTYGKTVFQKD